jgi:hypothetical protein
VKFSEHEKYSYYQCLIQLEYINRAANHPIKPFDFRMTNTPGDGYDLIVNGGTALENAVPVT